MLSPDSSTNDLEKRWDAILPQSVSIHVLRGPVEAAAQSGHTFAKMLADAATKPTLMQCFAAAGKMAVLSRRSDFCNTDVLVTDRVDMSRAPEIVGSKYTLGKTADLALEI